MRFGDFLRVLRRRWQLVVALIVVGAAAGIGVTLATTKVYQATAVIFVAPSPSLSSNGSDAASGNTFVQNRVQSYTSIANSPAVTKLVIAQLRLSLSNQALADKISADAPLNKVLINLHVDDTNAQTAATLANAVASAFDRAVTQTESTDATGQPVVKLSVIQPARVPTDPTKPNPTLNIALGLIVGIVLGVGLAVLLDALDTSVKTPEDFAEFDTPVLGLVPFDKRAAGSPIAFRDDAHSARAEAYRQLRTNLQFINVDDAPRVIAVTSAVPGEGKTTTALNLAAALAEAGFRVALIEADLRRPTIAKALGLVSDVGFTTTLIGKADPADVLQPVGRNLAVLTCGPVPPNPSELLITEQARTIIRRVADLADYTIIDTAPLIPVADGAEVAAMADATIVVHHSGKSTRDQVARSLDALERVGERPVGAVLNMMSRKRATGDYYYGYTYTYRPDRSRAVSKPIEPASGRHSSGDSSSESTDAD